MGDAFISRRGNTQKVKGNALPSDVLAEKTFSSEAAGIEAVGTMPNRGQAIITPGRSNIAIPAGYHDGTGYVKGDTNLVSENIIQTKSIFGVEGSAKRLVAVASDNYRLRADKYIRHEPSHTDPIIYKRIRVDLLGTVRVTASHEQGICSIEHIRDGNIIASESVGTSGGGTATVTWSVLPGDEIRLKSRPTSTYQPWVRINYLRVGYDCAIDTSPDNSRVLKDGV